MVKELVVFKVVSPARLGRYYDHYKWSFPFITGRNSMGKLCYNPTYRGPITGDGKKLVTGTTFDLHGKWSYGHRLIIAVFSRGPTLS